MPGISARAAGPRKIARSLWIAGVAISFATIAPAVLAASGNRAATDSVAVCVPASSIRVASSRAASPAETRIADFRYGAPRMGSTPRLPIPPPHRMRSGSAHPFLFDSGAF